MAVGATRIPSAFARTAALAAQTAGNPRILVVLEMSGGNDGLNTLVPYADDAYYRLRPKIGIRAERLRKIDDRFGFNSGMVGFERLYKDGKLAVVHGCGYENPSFSHFTSMAYWHTAAPNRGDENGWVGRTADAIAPQAPANYLVNIDARQSLAVRSRLHTPLVFDDPNKFARESFYQEREFFAQVTDSGEVQNPSRRFLLDVSRSAKSASALVKEAWAKYKSPVDYGIAPLDLPKVTALIDAGMPTRLYYVAYRNNAFDTHVYQGDLHQRLLTYTSDAVSAFMVDLERIGRANDVAVMIFLRVWTTSPGKHQPRHGSRRRKPDVCRRQESQGRPLRERPESGPTRRRRQSCLHNRFPARLRHDDFRLAGFPKHSCRP
jgi:uncharacterized protein (DUF1501 family)